MLETVQRAGGGGRYVHAVLKVLVSRLMPASSSRAEPPSKGLAGLWLPRGLPSTGLGPSVSSARMVLQIRYSP